MQTQQSQGSKIKLLVKKQGLQLKWLADQSGWSEAGLSRKINSDDIFEIKKLAKISRALGISLEYLRDTSRPFRIEDEIPEDAIIKVPPEDSGQGNLGRLFDAQIKNMQYNQEMQLLEQNKILAESVRNVTEVVSELMEEVRRIKDELKGNHDPD